ncbi:MAG: nitroreductase family protein [Planctomycetes bacterium]|nr:nitroreductase family protein [Planctomycetota bacterium]
MGERGIPPVIDAAACTGCELCVRACPAFVLAMEGGKARVVRGDGCIACGHCGAVCPVAAVTRRGADPEPPIGTGEAPAVPFDALRRLFRERRSVRILRPDPVPREAIERILDAARFTPTGTNSENVRYIVVATPAAIAELRAKVLAFYEKLFARVRSPIGACVLSAVAGRRTVAMLRAYLPKVDEVRRLYARGEDPLFHGAPVLVIAHAEAWDSCSAFNASAALYAASLAAHASGLGCCFNGFADAAINHDRSIRAHLELPRDHRCFASMTIGHPAVRYARGVARESAKIAWR